MVTVMPPHHESVDDSGGPGLGLLHERHPQGLDPGIPRIEAVVKLAEHRDHLRVGGLHTVWSAEMPGCVWAWVRCCRPPGILVHMPLVHTPSRAFLFWVCCCGAEGLSGAPDDTTSALDPLPLKASVCTLPPPLSNQLLHPKLPSCHRTTDEELIHQDGLNPLSPAGLNPLSKNSQTTMHNRQMRSRMSQHPQPTWTATAESYMLCTEPARMASSILLSSRSSEVQVKGSGWERESRMVSGPVLFCEGWGGH